MTKTKAVSVKCNAIAQSTGKRRKYNAIVGGTVFYDPPWTLLFRRRNEVAVPVAHALHGDQRWSSR